METRTLDPHDDAQMRRFHEIMWRAEKEDGRPWNAMLTFDELSGLLRRPTSESRHVGIAAHEGDRMVGAGWLALPLLDNRHTGWGFVAVEPELRGRGIGEVVLDDMVVCMKDEARSCLNGGAAVPFEERESSPILAWAAKHGFEVANTEIQRDLRLPVDPQLLDSLAAEAAGRHAEYDVRTYTSLPDELLPSWCELTNQFALEAPMGDFDLEAGALTPEALREMEQQQVASGRQILSAVAVQDGRVVANSDLAVSSDGHEAHQWTTLVHREHRGHRLGLAVKVANLRALAEQRPEVAKVVTTNAETNPWMVSINDRLGFEPVAVVPGFQRRL